MWHTYASINRLAATQALSFLLCIFHTWMQVYQCIPLDSKWLFFHYNYTKVSEILFFQAKQIIERKIEMKNHHNFIYCACRLYPNTLIECMKLLEYRCFNWTGTYMALMDLLPYKVYTHFTLKVWIWCTCIATLWLL